MLSSSLIATSICIFLLVVLLPQPSVGVDVRVATEWSKTLKEKLEDIELQKLMADDVIRVINRFDSLSPPGRQTPDAKWVQALAAKVQILMDSKASVAKKLAAEVERLYEIKLDNDDGKGNTSDCSFCCFILEQLRLFHFSNHFFNFISNIICTFNSLLNINLIVNITIDLVYTT